MKKINAFLVSAIFATFVIMPKTSSAQKEQGQSVVTGGVGYSLVGAFFSLVKEAVNTAPNSSGVSAKTIPVIAGMYDYGISDKFSLGAAYTYQSFEFNYDSYEDTTSGVSVVHYGDFYNRLSRQNFAIRPLFHFGNSESLDMYSGVRLGYTLWKHTTNNPNMYNETFDGFIKSRVRVQALFGMRYFFSEMIGMNVEFAVGPTYFTMIGVNLKF